MLSNCSFLILIVHSSLSNLTYFYKKMVKIVPPEGRIRLEEKDRPVYKWEKYCQEAGNMHSMA
jgi:hypothetical protein